MWESRSLQYQNYPCQQVGVGHHDLPRRHIKDLLHSASQDFVLMWSFCFTKKRVPGNGSQKYLYCLHIYFTSDLTQTVKFSKLINSLLSVIDTVCNHTTSWTFYFHSLSRKKHFTMLEWKVAISVCYQHLLYCQILWCVESRVSRVRLTWTARQRAFKTVDQSEKILSPLL